MFRCGRPDKQVEGRWVFTGLQNAAAGWLFLRADLKKSRLNKETALDKPNTRKN
jgi:uncharacterized C2H2 Zn-finger protein